MDIDKKALVYKGTPPNHCCCDTALRFLPSGDMAVIFMTGGIYEPEKANHVRISRSSDRGETWSEPEVVIQFDDRAVLLSEVYVRDGKITVMIHTHNGSFGEWRNWTIISKDDGFTWSEPVEFYFPRRTFFRTLYVKSDGQWLLPFQSYDTVDDWKVAPHIDGSVKNPFCGVLISDDKGKNWRCSGKVEPVFYWAENNIVELSDGVIAMLVRADGTGFLWRSDSRDGGKTWGECVPTDIPNPGTKMRLFKLSDGRIVLIHNPNSQTSHPNNKYRNCACHRNPLAIWISDDDMNTWGYKRILTDFPGMLAYPDGEVDQKEEYVHFAFDYNRHDVIYWGAKLPQK
jgi:predicted neuraminidase